MAPAAGDRPAGSEGNAEHMARGLLDKQSIACSSVIPRVLSLCRWSSSPERSEEALMVLKTTAAVLAPVVEAITRLHTDDAPMIIALPVLGGGADRLSWLAGEVCPTKPPEVR